MKQLAPNNEPTNRRKFKFTFAITTDFTNIPRINTILQNIASQTINSIEVLIVGDEVNINSELFEYPNLRIFNFDSKNTFPPGRDYLRGQNTFWISKKKNILIDEADSDIIVMMHDYYVFPKDFCETITNIESSWDICMPHVVSKSGANLSHWVSWDHPTIRKIDTMPYDQSLARYAYIPGSFWVAKTDVMKNEKIREDLVWHEDWLHDNYSNINEDIEFSLRLRAKGYKYIFNTDSTVVCLKDNKYGLGPWVR